MSPAGRPAWTIGILGATGAVGRTFLDCLETAPLEIERLVLTASPRSEGVRLPFRGVEQTVHAASLEQFEGCDLVLCSAGARAAGEWAEPLAAAGMWVVDNSSRYRMDPRVPLIVPEVNRHRMPPADGSEGRLIANPNCSTIQLAVALAPLDRRFGLRRVAVSTYQSAAGKGQVGIDAFQRETKGETPPAGVFPTRLHENVIPQVDIVLDDGWTREEEKMLNESRKILDRPDLPVHVTCVRVPVLLAHSEAVYVELEREFTLAEVEETLGGAEGIHLHGPNLETRYPTPYEAAGSDPVWIGRLRRDRSDPKGLYLWIVADNLRKGAALNAVQIAGALWRRATMARASVV